MDLTQIVATSMAVDADVALDAWAESGAMSLTGRADGPALAAPARIAPAMAGLADRLEELTARVGRRVRVDGAALLSERAAIAGLTRAGSTSCGGASRLLRVSETWIALSLARPSDIELIPAWLERPLPIEPGPATDSLWADVGHALCDRDPDEIVARAALLGLPCARLGEVAAEEPIAPVVIAARHAPTPLDRCVVVDLSSLWAGPLCANLLGLAGARVIKVESSTRPDGARDGPAGFFDLLHAGHQSVALPLQDEAGRERLAALLRVADIVVESSRPRALEAMGIVADELLGGDGPAVWLSITGYGRHDEGANRVAFGDDAAVAGGLVAVDDGVPIFCADAIGDPASGLLAAVAVLELIDRGVGGLADIALARTCAHLAAGLQRNPAPSVPAGSVIQPAPPAARPSSGVAAPLGADTDAVIRELGLR